MVALLFGSVYTSYKQGDRKMPKKEDDFLGFNRSDKGRYVEDKNRLEEIVNALRTIGAKIVLTMGTFDLIHIGHFLYLEKAKSHGDVLIVGVDSDEKVKKRKGPDRPIVKQAERVQMLTHVRHVDVVTLKESNDPHWALIKLVQPDVLIATKQTYTAAEVKSLKKYCGKVIVLEPQATTSTTARLRLLNIDMSSRIKKVVTKSVNNAFEQIMKDVK